MWLKKTVRQHAGGIYSTGVTQLGLWKKAKKNGADTFITAYSINIYTCCQSALEQNTVTWAVLLSNTTCKSCVFYSKTWEPLAP